MSVKQRPITLDRFIRSAVEVGLSANAALLAAQKVGYRVRRQTFYRLFRAEERRQFDK